MFSFFKKKEEVSKSVVQNVVQDFNDILPVAQFFKNETGVIFDKQLSILQNKVTTFCKQRDINSFLDSKKCGA